MAHFDTPARDRPQTEKQIREAAERLGKKLAKRRERAKKRRRGPPARSEWSRRDRFDS